MKSLIKYFFLVIVVAPLCFSCSKKDRPELGDYPTDEDRPPLPGGPLRFFVPFAEDPQERYQAKDSISGDPAQVFPFDLTDGVNGKAAQFTEAGQAIKYMTANDMDSATSLSIAFWMKNTEKARTEFVFSLFDPTYGWSQSAAFLLLEHGSPTDVTFKFGLMDQWLEFPDSHKFNKPLMDGEWHHLVIVYDETTSAMAYYFDGARVTDVPASALNVVKDGSPRGALDFTKSKGLVIGGWNKHANLGGPTDDWARSFSGTLDQFRLYNKALTAAEVAELYSSKE